MTFLLITLTPPISGVQSIFVFKGGVLQMDAGRDAALASPENKSLSGGWGTPTPSPPPKKKNWINFQDTMYMMLGVSSYIKGGGVFVVWTP